MSLIQDENRWMEEQGRDMESGLSQVPAQCDCSIADAWPPRDVVEKLCQAADMLLNDYNYDGHGHEEMSIAVERGWEWINQSNREITSP